MIDQLYQKAILKYAAQATGSGKIAKADRELTVHNPLCGDRITVYVNMDQDRVTDFSHETKACVLCQASAAILADCTIDETEKSLQVIYAQLKEGLAQQTLENKEWPEEKWQALNIFQPVSDHKNRFTCVTLPFESLLKALRGDQE